MRLAAAILLLLPPRPDPWFGADKVKHFFISAFVQSVTFAAVRAVGAEYRPALSAATAVTAVAGLGREVHDRRAKGQFSVRDLVWDAAGAVVASQALIRTRH